LEGYWSISQFLHVVGVFSDGESIFRLVLVLVLVIVEAELFSPLSEGDSLAETTIPKGELGGWMASVEPAILVNSK
jgi:hypothetical protein